MSAKPPDPALEARVALQQVLAEARRGRRALTLRVGAVLLVVIFCLWFTDFLNGERLAEGVPALGVMFSEMIPPDFRRWQQWIRPMLDTVAMSIAGTALAIVMSVPIAFSQRAIRLQALSLTTSLEQFLMHYAPFPN